jgi:signal transduction histidine kinase
MEAVNKRKIAGILKHIPLTLKMLMTTVVIGFIAWAIMDYFQTRNMKMVFDMHVSDFIPREQYESMSKPVLVTDRQNRALTALFLIFSFSIIGIWITRRIQGLSDRMVTSSKQHLGIELEESIYGDQLDVLEMQFHRLTEEVVLSRDSLLEEKRNLEVTHEEVVIKNWEIDENRKKLRSALDEISSLIQEASHGKGFEVRSVNHMLGNCYELLSCGKTLCPCYGKKGIKCWEEEGTLCNEDNSEDIADQPESCEKCLVFNETAADPVFQIGEYFNNMMQILESKNMELEKAYEELKATQSKILQQEKMASIGQLAAGVAHEINNPIGFITSNLGTLGKYVEKFTGFIQAQSEVIAAIDSASRAEELKEMREKLKLDYVMEDVNALIKESLDGAGRVKTIVQDLKTFSRVDEAMYQHADINECIESTLNIVWNELKYKTTVQKEYGEIPLTKCYPQQLNQVFMNLLVNSAHAIEKQGEIVIKTWNGSGVINISISDTGSGIPKDKLNRIFEPFFTTKEIGKGTGLGLSITYDIVKKHNGDITVESEEGKGTVFTLKIPVVEER